MEYYRISLADLAKRLKEAKNKYYEQERLFLKECYNNDIDMIPHDMESNCHNTILLIREIIDDQIMVYKKCYMGSSWHLKDIKQCAIFCKKRCMHDQLIRRAKKLARYKNHRGNVIRVKAKQHHKELIQELKYHPRFIQQSFDESDMEQAFEMLGY